MKIFVGLLVAACAFQAVFALPAGSPQDDVEIVRPTGEAANTDDFNDFKGVISTGTDDGYPFFQRSPQSFAFNLGFFDAFEDILRRLQARIYPQSVDSSSSDESSSSVLGRFDFDEGKANKTSTVRVENNLKVVVNDTFYDGDTGLFRVRTVNIRPLDSGEEVVEGTFHHDGSFVPATEGPKQAGVATKDREDADSDEDDSKREPLAKDETENEIRRNADQPESSTTPRDPAAQSFLPNTDDDGSASDLNAAFVTDNTQGNNSNNNDEQEQEPIVSESSRTETNKPANDENCNSAAVESVEVHDNQAKKMEENYQDDAVDAVVGGIDEEPNHYGSEALSNLESGRLTIENNEETEQQQQNDEHDKLNESSSAATKATTDDAAETEVIGEVVNAETNDEQDEQDDAEDAEDTQSSSSSGSSEFAAYEKAAEAVLAAEAEEEFEAEAAHAAFEMAKEREDLASSSSDDEDGNFEMNPTFNAEWSEFAAAATADNDKSATNDISNDIDVYDAVPIDLSNDIAVINWAAAQGNAYPYNPDAEIISDAADRIPTAYNAIPRFERLTINTHHMK